MLFWRIRLIIKELKDDPPPCPSREGTSFYSPLERGAGVCSCRQRRVKSMSLKDIIGQDNAVRMLLGILKRQKVASSYLFCGETGVGKKTAAIAFAKAVNCLSPRPPGPQFSEDAPVDACDECESCTKIDAGVHPDFLLVSPEERLIRIDEIRMIDEALSYKPFEGRKKTVIIDDAETMNISAANAFLKTLEEPPEDSVIILVTSKADLLPATIRSRCSRINFPPLPTGSCRQVLEGKENDAEKLSLAARLSMGRPGIALSSDLAEERTWFLNLFKGMLLAEKDGWSSRDDMERWFDHVLVFFRDMTVLKLTNDPAYLVNADLEGYFTGLSKSVDVKVIIYIHRELSRMRRLLQFNLNKSITWNYTASLLRKVLVL
jgi:DNA polymerase-3 subunit delta'